MANNSVSMTAFNGELSRKMQNSIHLKRLSLGLSYSELAAFFNVHWTTIRKWENGSVSKCNPSHSAMLMRFLAGECDHLFNISERRINQHTLYERQAEQKSRSCIGQLSSCCRMLKDRPELMIGLLDNLTIAVNTALRQYSALHTEEQSTAITRW